MARESDGTLDSNDSSMRSRLTFRNFPPYGLGSVLMMLQFGSQHANPYLSASVFADTRYLIQPEEPSRTRRRSEAKVIRLVSSLSVSHCLYRHVTRRLKIQTTAAFWGSYYSWKAYKILKVYNLEAKLILQASWGP
ncbi:hypothetical protein EYR41_006774 [Orbilia oligospora]|uniref:Uncharacterized protein n=1 Tax=Orbilia oligospora TaxID=2813651 RepID=A0A7C8TX63_ORBOL|nr:hypothetical protein TWF751_000184 [Orbilia oligospora]TGJ67661.1 hypothetical protein EYR41_006774 [Orbilia oligospora]